jgi:hypothetical protein
MLVARRAEHLKALARLELALDPVKGRPIASDDRQQGTRFKRLLTLH